jgi:predicted DNA binding CopG/RHH family protein
MQQTNAYEDLPDLELDPAMDATIREMTATADRDLEEVRVSIRWRRQQLATVKQAARLKGIPYQAYVKNAVLRQALADIRNEQPGAVLSTDVSDAPQAS